MEPIRYRRMCASKGRNGVMKQTGIFVNDTTVGITILSALNSKGDMGVGYLQIPTDALSAVIERLQQIKAANE